MADDHGETGTEAPTLRRREEAREQGRVAFSAELSTGLLLLAGVAGLWFGGEALANGLLQNLRLDLLSIHRADIGPEQVQGLFASFIGRFGEVVGYFLGLTFVVAVGVGALQVGFHVNPDMLSLKWEKLSPVAGWSRIVSMSAGMKGLVTIVKVTLVLAVAVWILHGRNKQIAALGQGSLANGVSQAWDLVMRLALALAAILVLIGLVDYLFQRWRHERSLMMTRQELKEEAKRDEGDPQIRARLRKLQREVSKRRMLDDVPRASVVIANPTHLAIALRYDRGTMKAPKVIAKGAGHVAERIKDLARRHAVPVVERKPVAQALYKAVKVGDDIPQGLYLAIAEILAYVYRLRNAA
jgi:flagellar biosynthetic protein FlhB